MMNIWNHTLQKKFLFTITLIIVPVLGLVFGWVEFQNIQQVREESLGKARIISRQVILTRKWIIDCGGGVLVPALSQGAEHINCFFDHRFEVGDKLYRRFTPAMVTKKLSLYSSEESLYSFRLSSLTPMNPENIPNEFERLALHTFIGDDTGNRTGGGTSEAWHFGNEYLEYMVPLYIEKACLKCHSSETISIKTIMGGLSVIIPIQKIQSSLKRNGMILAASAVCVTLLTITTLFVLMRHMIIKPLNILEEQTREISRGNFETRITLDTGDELERLGQSFNIMAQSLLEGRENLEKKIAQATEELATAHAELKDLDRLKSDFLANMSHELRSPITVIRGGINYLSRTLEREEDRSYAEIIEKNVARLSRLVSDLFDFTKLEAGKINWDFDRENITVLVEEVIEIISPLAMKKNLDVTCEHPGDLFVNMDFERMEQVLVNIIDNAIKYSYPDTNIAVRIVSRDDGWVTVSIRDHGPGIPNHSLETIFDKFSTVPTGRNSKLEGTGLGLAISRTIVEAHGGNIHAESVEGRYSVFFITLPEFV